WHDDPEFADERESFLRRWFDETLPALDGIGAGDTAVIWYGDNPTEVCGMLFAVHRLWTQGAAIEFAYAGGEYNAAELPKEDHSIACASAVGVITDHEWLNRVLRYVPQFILRIWYERGRRKSLRKNGREVIHFRGAGELHPGYIPYFYDRRRAVPDSEAEKLAARWETLVRENTPLRTLTDGKAVSVPADCYDETILSNVPEEPTRAALVIGRTLADLVVGDMLIYRRLRALIASGAVECVQDGANYRELIIRSAK
ncbi:MAG: DUF1835 domain-containing protein, partial [Butyricicoccus sp.]|nr:DUF1835 domain-containing protein [Butyricicoccus sp.]